MRYTRRNRSRAAQRGGGEAAPFPGSFSALLPEDMHKAADIMSIDKAYSHLPEYTGKYGGMSGGGRRRKSRRAKKQRGGLSPANVSMPSMLLTPAEEKAAFVAPQYYTENVEVPNFRGPANVYVQKAGRRNSRKARNAIRKNRK